MRDAFIYIIRRWDRLLDFTLDHLWIILLANAIAMVLGVFIGVFISGEGLLRRVMARIILYIAGIIQTVPSLALFGILLPILVYFNLPGIGFLPAVIALVLYAQLTIIRNTYTAIRGVDRALIEAGQGMGMTNYQILYRIKLPIAIPVIMAGLRTAVVTNIGIAAIAAYIGAGGLGRPIFEGIVRSRMDIIIAGAILVSILALIADTLLSKMEKWLTPKGLR